MSQDAAEPIRIGFVLHAMQVAGAEMLVAEIIRRLGTALDPAVLCLDHVGQLGERLRAEGVPVVAFQRRPGLDLAVSRRLAREVRTRRIDILHAHQYTPFFYSALSRLLVRRPLHLMFTEHGRHYPDVVSWKRRNANRFVLGRMADEINAVCRFSADSLAAIDGFDRRRIEIIENGIDVPAQPSPSARMEGRARLGLSPTRRYVICVARFHPVKDHRTLLRAFTTVATALPDTDLLLAGDGPLRGELERQATASGIGGRVHFLGVRQDVPALLAASDVFTLTSVSEAASLTLLEAMAAGLPVVVTAVGGNPEIVRAGIEGQLAGRGDSEGLARALIELLNDPARSRSMGDAGRLRVSECYQLDRTVSAYHQRYAAAIHRLHHSAS